MTTDPSKTKHDDHGPHGHQVEDEIDFTKVISIGVVSLLIFAIGTWWAASILRHETARVQESTGASRPAELGKDEIGIVDQVPFITDHRLQVWREAHEKQLGSYGWVDKQKGVAHIPIERAMDAIASGAAPAGAPK